MSLPVVFHEGYVAPLRADHRFPMSKYGYLRQMLSDRGLAGGMVAPAEAGQGLLTLAHAPDYVDRVLGRTLGAAEVKTIGLPLSEILVRRVRLSSAGTLLAARLALEHGVAANGAGGSHHAARGMGAGYCVFNDVAVAASALLADGTIGAALVIDLDVHQGDGTARIFEGDQRVFTLSLHAARNYPEEKAASDMDVPLDDGLDDAAYLAALHRALEEVEGAYDIVFYNAGVDVHGADRLGRLSLTDAGLRARDRAVMDWAKARALPVVGVLGGGYGRDPGEIAARHVSLFEEAARIA